MDATSGFHLLDPPRQDKSKGMVAARGCGGNRALSQRQPSESAADRMRFSSGSLG
jgi:hypothetical protein